MSPETSPDRSAEGTSASVKRAISLARLDYAITAAQEVADWCDSVGPGSPSNVVGGLGRFVGVPFGPWSRLTLGRKLTHFLGHDSDRLRKLVDLVAKCRKVRFSSHISPRLARVRVRLPRPWR